LSIKEHKFAEMSTWQQELYVQVQVRVQVGLYSSTSTSTKYASEAITISTTTLTKIFAVPVVIMKTDGC